MTDALDLLLADLEARVEHCLKHPHEVRSAASAEGVRLLLAVARAAPKPSNCEGWDFEKDEDCQRPVTYAARGYEANIDWFCEVHAQGTPDPLGLAILALEAHAAGELPE